MRSLSVNTGVNKDKAFLRSYLQASYESCLDQYDEFLHDIGLFVEKYLLASSSKGVQAFWLSLHTLGAMPGGRICRA